MKKMRIFFAVVLALVLCFSAMPIAFAATVSEATIHTDRSCSLDLYKYDFTNAEKDGVWQEDSFVSTGRKESYVEEKLGNAVRKGDTDGASTLGNSDTSHGYAIKGVQFTYLQVADIVTYTEAVGGVNTTVVLYGFDKVNAADLITTLELTDKAYAGADTSKLDKSKTYFTSDTLNKALADALAANATTVKDALEAYVGAHGGTAMPYTDEYGHTHAENLAVGVYLLVETQVPEMVTCTTNPFFVSLPMTTVDGDSNSANGAEGGLSWNYNVTVYPKNETGIPTLEKTVRESQADTGKNGGSAAITDGYAHTATASTGDILDYQIISTLPNITSTATSLSVYKFYDEISAGLSYRTAAKDVKIEFFKDKACTQSVAVWTQTDPAPKFEVAYAPAPDAADFDSMTITVNDAGLAEINGRTSNEFDATFASYSNYTARVTYTVLVDSDATAIFGEGADSKGNCNKVTLTWQRSSRDYYDTLVDDCHVYTFGIDLTKTFSDKASESADDLFAKVKFKLYNKTDDYWVVAKLNEAEGVYYVTDHATGKETGEDAATAFVPVTSDGKHGRIIIKGLEDDEYVLTETETANLYSLLKDDVTIVISAMESGKECDVYNSDLLGVTQNDARYNFDGGKDLKYANIPQIGLHHKLLTAKATVDGNAVTMLADNGSVNALVPLTVLNTHGFNIPQTGAAGTLIVGFAAAAFAAGAVILFMAIRKKSKEENGAE